MKKILIFLGPPGSGKGTQAKIIAARYNYGHISTGDLLRALAKKPDLDEDESLALGAMRAGKLVPDWLIYRLAFAAADSFLNQGRGVVFDGAIRNVQQAQMYQEYFVGKNLVAAVQVIEIAIPDSMSLIRLSGRRVCKSCGAIASGSATASPVVCSNCGGELAKRADDDLAVVKKRIVEQGNQSLAPLRAYYQKLGVLKTVDGSESVEATEKQIEEILKK